MGKHMTYRQVVDEFKQTRLPGVPKMNDGNTGKMCVDYVARSEEWNAFVDELLSEGRIREDLRHPSCCLSPDERRQRRP